jgi:hypothetical protein
MFASIKFNPKSLSIQAQVNQSNSFSQIETDLSVVLSIIALLISFKIVGLLSISWIVSVSASAALLVVPFIVTFVRVNKTIHHYKTK